MARVLAWDRSRTIRPAAIQSQAGEAALDGMPWDERMASWHLVAPDGRRHSGGAAIAPLMALLPGGRPLGALARAVPRLADHGYRFVARRRRWFGRWVGADARARADRLIAARSARVDPPPH